MRLNAMLRPGLRPEALPSTLHSLGSQLIGIQATPVMLPQPQHCLSFRPGAPRCRLSSQGPTHQPAKKPR